MKKRILSIVLAVAMLVCMIPVGMVTVYAGYYVNNTATLQSYGTNGGDAYIDEGKTFTLTSTVTVAAGKKLIVDLHGGYIVPSGNFQAFKVYGTLILVNKNASGGGCIDGQSNDKSKRNCPLIEVYDGGKVYIDDNSSTNPVDIKNSYYDWGGAVIVRKGGYLELNKNGYIKNCKAANGGGVLLESGTFTMNGGEINGCSATDTGGGVYANKKTNGIQGTFTMNGGVIKNCSAANGGLLIYMNGGVANYKVNYDLKSGTGGTTSSYATYGSAMPAITLPTRNGYTFSGYYDGSGTKYYNANGTSAKNLDKAGAPTILYAQWSQDKTLTYNANGHGTAPSSVTMKYTAATNAADALSADGYLFLGWNTEEKGTGTSYAPNAVVKAANVDPAATTLYAQWQKLSYENYLVTAPTVDENGLYNQRSYYINSSNEKVVVEERVLDTDREVDFASWYLRTFAQVKNVDGNMDVRLISMLNGENLLDYDCAGFKITIDGMEITPATTKIANTSFLANNQEIFIKDYSRETDYFFLANNVFAEELVNANAQITATPFVKLMDGTIIEGKTVSFKLGDLR